MMTSIRSRSLAVAAAFMLSVVFALPSGGAAQTMPLRSGTWKLNVAKSRYDPGPAPTSSTRVDEASSSRLKTTVEGVDARGGRVAYRYDVRYDGKDHPIVGTGTPSGADSLMFTRVDKLTAEGTLKKNGKVVQTTTTLITEDGKIMTVTSKGTSPTGQPTHNVTIWEKQ